MKKICLFSTKAIKNIEGDEPELYVNFYLVLNRNYIFTFLINAPNLSCTDRHPIKLWKHFLIMLEEENVKLGFSGKLNPVIVRNEKGQKYTHIIMPRWRNFFTHIWNSL